MDVEKDRDKLYCNGLMILIDNKIYDIKNQISLSIKDSELLPGTWQGSYLFEHRLEQQNRAISHHLIGDI